MDASNPPNRPSQAQKPVQAGQSQPAQTQNSSQAAAQSQGPNTAASKTSSIDNNMAAPRKECESIGHDLMEALAVWCTSTEKFDKTPG